MMLTSQVFFYTDISDRFSVFSILLSKAPAKDKNKLTTFIKITPSEQVTFINAIAKIEWLDVLQANNPDIAYDLFITKMKTVYERCFPLSTLKIKCKTKRKPWMTQALISSCKRKNKLYKQWLLNKSIKSLEKYKLYKKKLTHKFRIIEK